MLRRILLLLVLAALLVIVLLLGDVDAGGMLTDHFGGPPWGTLHLGAFTQLLGR